MKGTDPKLRKEAFVVSTLDDDHSGLDVIPCLATEDSFIYRKCGYKYSSEFPQMPAIGKMEPVLMTSLPVHAIVASLGAVCDPICKVVGVIMLCKGSYEG